MMKRSQYITLIVLLLLLAPSLMGQYTVQLKVNGIPTRKAYLYEFVGARTGELIDSSMVAANGLISFKLKGETHPGMYRLVMGPQTWLDFVFNRENIVMETYFDTPVDSLRVTQSKENELWLRYMNFYLVLNRKQDYLQRLLSVYTPNEEFYQHIRKELTMIRQTDPETESRKIIRDYPDTYVARFLKAELSPPVPQGLGMKEELNYLLEHFFDLIDFNDTGLIYSPPFISRVNAFFNLYQQAYPPAEVEEAMISGLNLLLSKAVVNDEMYSFLLDQLTLMFEHSEFETFFAYFTENFLLDGSCKDEDKNQELEEILAAIKKTEIGKKAPEIILPLTSGPVVLSTMKNKYKLVLFWASWCGHCTEVLPQIHDIYKKHRTKGLEVIAISLDTDAEAYQKSVQVGGYAWINYSELKGWDCSIAYDYGIRATPTMILVDKNGVIVGKPRNPEVLEEMLKSLL